MASCSRPCVVRNSGKEEEIAEVVHASPSAETHGSLSPMKKGKLELLAAPHWLCNSSNLSVHGFAKTYIDQDVLSHMC